LKARGEIVEVPPVKESGWQLARITWRNTAKAKD
jgi:hypothetical protein